MATTRILRFAIGVGLVLCSAAPAAQAQPIQGCTQNGSMELLDHLEASWNAGDADAALALFATNAVAASSSGMRWQGEAALREFLAEFWDPTQLGEPEHVDTLCGRQSGKELVWIFRYSAS